MRTKRIKLYKFEELSEQAQLKAINAFFKKEPYKDYTHALHCFKEREYEFLEDGTKF